MQLLVNDNLSNLKNFKLKSQFTVQKKPKRSMIHHLYLHPPHSFPLKQMEIKHHPIVVPLLDHQQQTLVQQKHPVYHLQSVQMSRLFNCQIDLHQREREREKVERERERVINKIIFQSSLTTWKMLFMIFPVIRPSFISGQNLSAIKAQMGR